ncbi:MAG: hypothetical protein WDN69_04640 [Aliidongia sp.]
MSLVARLGLNTVLLAAMAGGAVIVLAAPPLGMPAAAAIADETPAAPSDTPPPADSPPAAPAPDAPPPADTTPAPGTAAPPPFPGAPIPLAPSPNQAPVVVPPLPAVNRAPAQAAFMADSEQLTTTAPTPVYGAPVASGPPRRVIPAGTRVQLAAKTADGRWGWLQTPDNQEAYVQMATLSVRPAAPAVVLPDTLTAGSRCLRPPGSSSTATVSMCSASAARAASMSGRCRR